eukprot:Plantae.Rhodophyta-Purpureofilum_apyrenoidigerum.ctg38691.p1 GENE.Plantae.Rhodophyta-Purpureofilum_apyrenoidigerum.ctg38691~~Plantae.Rhodophyta-Purpureofilum_apyrenoidigerum.ctg38691.p1  ORF type:complete len:148 (+),score=25.75 Plantae.Rhodophyta-Purpureofilum_apyrenoidigerum.ctg38691:192-635(+)
MQIGVNVFGMPSKYTSVVLTIGQVDGDNEPVPFLPFDSVREAVNLGLEPGQNVVVDYPFLAKAKVIALSDESETVFLDDKSDEKRLVFAKQSKDELLGQSLTVRDKLYSQQALRLLKSKVTFCRLKSCCSNLNVDNHEKFSTYAANI